MQKGNVPSETDMAILSALRVEQCTAMRRAKDRLDRTAAVIKASWSTQAIPGMTRDSELPDYCWSQAAVVDDTYALSLHPKAHRWQTLRGMLNKGAVDAGRHDEE